MTKELELAARAAVNEWTAEADSVTNSPTGLEAVRQTATLRLADFALAQLRRQLAELESRGYAGHKDDCARFRHPHYKLQCDCRWDEMKRELGGPGEKEMSGPKICVTCDEPVTGHKPDCKSWDAYMRRQGYKEYSQPCGECGSPTILQWACTNDNCCSAEPVEKRKH